MYCCGGRLRIKFRFLTGTGGRGGHHLLKVAHDSMRTVFRKYNLIHAGQTQFDTVYVSTVLEHFSFGVLTGCSVVDDGNTNGIVTAGNVPVINRSIPFFPEVDGLDVSRILLQSRFKRISSDNKVHFTPVDHADLSVRRGDRKEVERFTRHGAERVAPAGRPSNDRRSRP